MSAVTAWTAPEPEPACLFEIDDSQRVPPPQKANPDQRRAQLQAEKFTAGWHPITGMKLHPDAAPYEDRQAPGRRCGTCRFRAVLGYHNKTWPKCLNPGGRGADEIDEAGPPFVTHGAGTDVPRWFPACVDHSYADRKLSVDAARCVPGVVAS